LGYKEGIIIYEIQKLFEERAMKIRYIALAGMALLLLSACTIDIPKEKLNGSGTIKMENRSVSGFQSVLISGIGNLTITQSDTESLSITTDDNILPLIKTSVNNNTLDISIEPGNKSITPTKGINYALTVKSLHHLTVSGIAKVTATDIKNSESDFTVELSGTGSVSIDKLTGTSLHVDISGAGSATLGGTVQSQDITLSGVGSYHADNLASETVRATISGVGNAVVKVGKSLDVTISGVGGLNYYGDPTVTQHVTGLGKVNKKG
jgi:hypothetical protein